MRVFYRTALLLSFVTAVCVGHHAAGAVRCTLLEDRVRVMIDGDLFTEYVTTNSSRPYCYPLYGPGQVPMTRNWPMKEVPGEDRDHPHHRSVWFAHGSVNGIDFWSEMPGAGKTVHLGVDGVNESGDSASFKTRTAWVRPDGTTMCTDRRTFQFAQEPKSNSRIMDWEITIEASHGDLVFGDTKEGTMAIRVAEDMKTKRKHGHILTSEGAVDDKAWATRAKWCEYYTDKAGIAMFDHPTNPRYPTWWHVRDYGLFAANPFGKHDFEKLADPKAGALTVKKGSSVTFRYRILLHKSAGNKAMLENEYKRWVSSPGDS